MQGTCVTRGAAHISLSVVEFTLSSCTSQNIFSYIFQDKSSNRAKNSNLKRRLVFWNVCHAVSRGCEGDICAIMAPLLRSWGYSFGPNLHLILSALTSRAVIIYTHVAAMHLLCRASKLLSLCETRLCGWARRGCHSSGVSHPNPLKFLRILLRNCGWRRSATTPARWEARGSSYTNLAELVGEKDWL